MELKELLQQAPSGIEWASIRELREEELHLRARDGRPDQNFRRFNHGVFCEVLVNGQFAYCAVSEPTQTRVKEAFQRAKQLAVNAGQFRLYEASASLRPPSTGSYRSPGSSALAASEKSLWDLILKSSEAARVSSRIISGSVVLWLVDSQSRILSSDGGEIDQRFHYFSSDVSAVASHNGEIQRRSESGHLALSYQGGLELLDSEQEMIARAQRIGHEAEELVFAPQCPTAKTDLLLAPDQMILQIHESIGHPLELDRILGDERNFAGWSFVRKEDFGSLKYGSDLLNISYDPTVREEYSSFAYDDCLARSEKRLLIEKGILVAGLGGVESQKRLGVPGVACTRASGWNRPPVDRMANLNMEPGHSTFEELLASIESGIYMESNRSWSIDDYRRKFQFGCEYGRVIESGRLGHVVKNPNYHGVTVPFWQSLSHVGNSDSSRVFGIPSCGKGEPQQMIRVGHASPACVFREVEVFGGGRR